MKLNKEQLASKVKLEREKRNWDLAERLCDIWTNMGDDDIVDVDCSSGGVDESGHYRCFFCNGEVMHIGSDMATDIYPDCEDDGVLQYMKCSKCGSEYEIIQHIDEDNNCMSDEIRLRKRTFSEDCDTDTAG